MRTRTLAIAAAVAVGLAGAAGSAQAVPLNVTGAGVTVWNYTNAGGNPGDPCEQGLALNTAGACTTALAGPAVYTGTYTGAINFTEGGSGLGNLATFLGSAGGAFTPNTVPSIGMSNAYHLTTLIDIQFTISLETIGNVNHDDGISIWNSTNTTKLVDSSAPTSDNNTAYDLLPGTYNLWYVEANGLPADLIMDVTSTVTQAPEPASLALFGAALLGFGVFRRRRKTA
jgi:hypothetical protein